jgi:hypothetical protein
MSNSITRQQKNSDILNFSLCGEINNMERPQNYRHIVYLSDTGEKFGEEWDSTLAIYRLQES